MTSNRGIYIHIPFCRQRCYYCHFATQTDLSLMDCYVDALVKEIETYRSYMSDLNTIYIGGGTPGLLEIKHLERICQALETGPVEEFTLEVNPESLTRDKLAAYRRLGVNRISMGVQTTDNQRLAQIGRKHRFEDAVEKVAWIREAGFENLNLDLIYGLPGQSVEDVHEDVRRILDLGPDHLSTYSLTIDEGTEFYRRKVQPVDDEVDREMFSAIGQEAQKSGLLRYEISNFAKPGFESRHNLLYWRAGEYIGLGSGAHGYLDGRRYGNVSSIHKYLSRVEKGESVVEFEELLDDEERIFEYIILNLRTVNGFDLEDFKKNFGFDFLSRYSKQVEQFVEYDAMKLENGRILLTDYGFDVSNSIYQAFR